MENKQLSGRLIAEQIAKLLSFALSSAVIAALVGAVNAAIIAITFSVLNDTLSHEEIVSIWWRYAITMLFAIAALSLIVPAFYTSLSVPAQRIIGSIKKASAVAVRIAFIPIMIAATAIVAVLAITFAGNKIAQEIFRYFLRIPH